MNDGIASEWSTVSYATADHLATVILSLGRGAYLVKADIKEAYRIIPVHPEDRWLLGMVLGREVLYRHSTAIRTPLGSQNLLSRGRRSPMDRSERGDSKPPPLFR